MARKFLFAIICSCSIGCASVKTYYPHGELAAKCRSWGSSKCEAAEGTPYHVSSVGHGLSENGMTAIVQSILELPEAIFKAIFPL
jgi:hypothetical protein